MKLSQVKMRKGEKSEKWRDPLLYIQSIVPTLKQLCIEFFFFKFKIKTLRNLSSVPLINKSGKKKFQRTPPSVPSSKKREKDLKRLRQVYPQENKIVKKKKEGFK